MSFRLSQTTEDEKSSSEIYHNKLYKHLKNNKFDENYFNIEIDKNQYDERSSSMMSSGRSMNNNSIDEILQLANDIQNEND